MSDELAVEASGLAKSFSDVRVLDGVDLRVRRGTVFALLGPNGAGKTTTVRILATLSRADGGQARVAGFDVVRDRHRVRRSISLTGQFAALDERQTGEENLRMMGRLSRLSRSQARQRAADLLEQFDLTTAGRRRVGSYSGGMRRRLGVLLLCAVTGASTTAVTVCQDMTSGIIDRFRSLDVPGTAVLSGHVTASLLRNIVSTGLVAAVAYGIGFRPHASPAGLAAAFGVLMLFVAAAAWLAAAFGLAVSAPEAANGVMFGLMFFTYASSAFAPVRTMPWWLRGFARHQPATSVTETIRGLLLGQPVGSQLGAALAWCGGLLAVSVVLSLALFRRRTA